MRRNSTLLIGLLVVGAVACGGSKSKTPESPAGGGETGETGGGAAETPPAPGEPVELAKNLQVLPKDTPLAQVKEIMKNGVAPSLGVECKFCHVENDFAADDNPKKNVARDMMRMVMEVNEKHFKGQWAVLCFTCHQGKEKPEVLK